MLVYKAQIYVFLHLKQRITAFFLISGREKPQKWWSLELDELEYGV